MNLSKDEYNDISSADKKRKVDKIAVYCGYVLEF